MILLENATIAADRIVTAATTKKMIVLSSMLVARDVGSEKAAGFPAQLQEDPVGIKSNAGQQETCPARSFYPSSAPAPPLFSGVANSSRYFKPTSTFSIIFGSVSPPFLGLYNGTGWVTKWR